MPFSPSFDWGEAQHQTERQGDFDGSVGGEDRAVVGKPLHRMRCANAAKMLSTRRAIMSRIIPPEMPAVVATQEIASQSWQSRAKATRTISPFQ